MASGKTLNETSLAKFIADDMTAEDFARVFVLHDAMGMPYVFPDLTSPLFPVKTVVRDQNGQIAAAGALKIISEAYLWLAPGMKVRDKLNAIGVLEADMREEAIRQGFDHVAAWLPPVSPGFERLLGIIGWQKSKWPTWARNL